MNYRTTIIKAFTFLGGIYFFLAFVLPESWLTAWQVKQHHEDITLGFISIGLLTFGLGIINLLMIHGSKLVYKRKGWIQSLALLCGLFTMVTFSLLDWREDVKVIRKTDQLNMLVEFARVIDTDMQSKRADVPPAEVRLKALAEASTKALSSFDNSLEINPSEQEPAKSAYANLLVELKNKYQTGRKASEELSVDLNIKNMPVLAAVMTEILSLERDLLSKQSANTFAKKFFKFLFEGLFVSLGSALFSLLGVYIAAAAYRAFRIRTWESSLMMLAALLVMLGQIPFGTWLYSEMPAIRSWILEIPNSAASRAISIGASVAGLVLAFRMWFSIESDSFSKGKK